MEKLEELREKQETYEQWLEQVEKDQQQMKMSIEELTSAPVKDYDKMKKGDAFSRLIFSNLILNRSLTKLI